MTGISPEKRPLLMIGLDAAEITLVRKWMAAGVLPNLSALLARGRFATLDPRPGWMVGALWPAFYASDTAERFGMYHYLIWRPETMDIARPAPQWMPLQPFWRHLHQQGRRVIAVDVPLCYAPGEYPGIELSGWATHELIQTPGSSPAGLLHEVRRDFGDPPFRRETTYRLSIAQSLDVRKQCTETARCVGELGCALMQKHPWDLALVCFSSLHRAGHLLWDRTILKGTGTPAELEAFDHALRDSYVACDAAIGRLVAQAGPEANVMVFSLHGMGPNSDRTPILPEMLERVLEARRSEGKPVREVRLADRLRKLVPDEWRARIKQHLPRSLKDKLTVYWRVRKLDWSRTRAFTVFCDLDGYLRINLRGRERDGIVPAEEYRALCEQIAAGLRTFRDADTGEPLVREVDFAERVFGDGPMRSHLPDLIIRWTESPACAHRRIVSDRYGSIAWPTPGRHPLGRAGNHRYTGFLIGAGEAFARGPVAGHAGIIDLAPTALHLLGLPSPESFRGRSLLPGEL